MGKRQVERLSAVAVKKATTVGYLPDGGGLYLQISPTGSKSWIYRFTLNKKERQMGLGSYPDVPLAKARELATASRLLAKSGIDPITARDNERNALQQQRTFAECAEEYHQIHQHTWRNEKHASQWTNTLKTYAYPIFGTKAVSDVSKADILAALTPIWTTKSATAARVKQRIHAVLDWAAAKDYRHNHDAGIWAQITRALPAGRGNRGNFAACAYKDVASTLSAIRTSGSDDSAKLALEFIVLTGARTGEVRLAEWSEIDFDGKRRIIPGERMKSGNEHRVPLSPRALEILEAQRGKHPKLIFPNNKGKPYSDMAFTATLRRLGYEFTVHGFRSSFRDWAAEQTSYPHAVCEAALAHTMKDKTEAAYFRSDLFDKRRELMNDWAVYCTEEKPSSVAQTEMATQY
ncbi:tyrosine-type recombinase/integrase [Pseudoduganella sp. SL102]|uniref:tyrosine-type recombinase/integrase n=1 Tax=Pseudoduganella sp. SL102 TaxID=2995154 RepID=UPI00248AE97C|nr:site-specific integrase [Pseudoduganella sp. SL102]WBS04652.1 tyrosine-type recombinase/integrase [Pseudoduganella sp. SL102]